MKDYGWKYEIWVVATRPYAEKAIGTAISTLVPECQSSGPGLFFYSEEDAISYRNQIEPSELRDTYKVFPAIIRVAKQALG